MCSTTDVLVALSLAGVEVAIPEGGASSARTPARGRTGRAMPGPVRAVYKALSADPAPLDELARATGLGISELCGTLEQLALEGLARDVGGWWERA